MRIISLRHATGRLAFRILHQQTTLGAFHENDKGDNRDDHDNQSENNEC